MPIPIPNLLDDSPVEQPSNKTSAYSSPEYHFEISEKMKKEFTACTAERRDNLTATAHACSKIFIDPKGDVLIESIQSLQERGWIKYNHSLRISPPNVRFSNPSYTDPDIKAVEGSCTLIQLNHNGQSFYVVISNDHVIYCARKEIESCSLSDYASDFNLIPLVKTFKTAYEKHTLPIAQLPKIPISNNDLPNREVEIIGVGGDLFRFHGRPFAIPTTVKYANGQTKQQTLFCLLTPNNFLHHSREIGGMSGSPVMLKGTTEIVGVLSNILPFEYYSGTNSTALIFAGPDELNFLIENSVAPLWDIHNQAMSKK